MTSQPTRSFTVAIEAATNVLAKAALLDPRISAGDEGTILAWAEVLAPHNLGVGHLLDAVMAHYATSTERIMPADVLRLARAAKRDRIDRSIGNDTAPTDQPQLPPATQEARRAAIAAAAAKIGAEHHPDTRREFERAPAQPKAESQATIAAKVARVRAAAPPTPLPPDPPVIDAEIGCDWHDDDRHCLLAANHLGPHHPSAAKANR